MRPYSLHPLLTAASLLYNDFEDLVLLSFLGAMDEEEEEYEDGDEGSEQEDDWNEDDDGGEEEEDEEEEEEEEGASEFDTEDEDDEGEVEEEEVEVEVDEQVVQQEEDDDDDDDDDTPVPPKRRLLHYPPSQPLEAGTSTGGITFPAVMRSAAVDPSQPGPASMRSFAEPVRRVIAQRPMPVLIQNTQPLQLRTNAASFQYSHSRSQQVQTDSPENGLPRPLVRQIAQHNLPQARVVLRLPNDIGDMYPREE